MELRSRKKLKAAPQSRHKKVKARLARPTGMTDLPPEVLKDIFLWSKCERTLPGHEREFFCQNYITRTTGCEFRIELEKQRHGINWKIDANTINPNEENPSYKSFRQVCRLWHHIVTPLLFETVVLLRHTDSWAHADSICGSPHLARYVRRLQVDATLRTIELPDSAPDDKEGLSIRTWLHNRDTPWLYGNRNPLRPKPSFNLNGGPSAKLLEDDESVYGRYKHWRQGEIAMTTHYDNGTTPPIHLELLCNIQRVEMVYHNDLATIKQRFDRPNRANRARNQSWRVQDNLTRREVETKVPYIEERRGIDARYLATFTKALEQSGLKIPTLRLREPKEIYAMRDAMSSHQSLRRLELDFKDAGYDDFEGELNLIYDDLVKYISIIPNLEELSITMPISPICQRFKKILDLLPDLTVPKLRSLSLKRVRATYDALKSFVDKHRVTLRSLSIKDIRIPVDDWERFCAEEQAVAWKVEGKTLLLTDRYKEEFEVRRRITPWNRR